MSTIDPRAGRDERARPGDAASRRSAIRAGLLLVLAAAIPAVGIMLVLDGVRINALDRGIVREHDVGAPVGIGLALVGAVVALAAWIGYTTANNRYAGTDDEYVGAAPGELALAGLALGGWLFALVAGRPASVGFVVSGADAGAAWDLGGWALYTAIWWLPAVALAFAVRTHLRWRRDRAIRTGALVVAPTAAETRRRATVEELLRTGRRTAGAVTDTLDRVDDPGEQVYEFGITFVDDAGTRRWFERWARFEPRSVPELGAPVTVLFDPARPGDESRIFWSPAAARPSTSSSRTRSDAHSARPISPRPARAPGCRG